LEASLGDDFICFIALQDAGLTAKPSKMFLASHEINFLGHIVGKGTMKPEPNKIEKILNIKPPTTKKQVQSLLGLMGYYRKFISNFADIIEPLNQLVRKGNLDKIKWSEECEQSLSLLKSLFACSPILILPNLNEIFIVRADASDSGIGAMLLQEKDDVLMPCAYASRRLLDREKRYAIIERECLAIVFALGKFTRYLSMVEFIIETDHKPLLYMKQKKPNNSRLLRWALAIQEFRFSIRAIAGSENVHADVLSRLTN
jgi:hypothetical protein